MTLKERKKGSVDLKRKNYIALCGEFALQVAVDLSYGRLWDNESFLCKDECKESAGNNAYGSSLAHFQVFSQHLPSGNEKNREDVPLE